MRLHCIHLEMLGKINIFAFLKNKRDNIIMVKECYNAPEMEIIEISEQNIICQSISDMERTEGIWD